MSSERLEPRWVNQTIAQAIHVDQIRQHGGTLGLRDKGLLESALQRAPNLWHYDTKADLCNFAATYGIGLAKNHPFVDGNKRISFQVM
jgi:death-on-curing protein